MGILPGRLSLAILAAATLALPASSYTILHEHRPDGANPYAALVSDGAGNLYGTTWSGGTANAGTVFRVKTDGTGFVVLHNFQGGAGGNPGCELLLDGSGNLYGTTYSGGTSYMGTLFGLKTDGSGYTILHSFEGGISDGATPQGGLVLDGAGNLYGTTMQGGVSNSGTLFKLNTAPGSFIALLHTFGGGTSDGSLPYATLTLDGSGNLYGTTYRGGASNLGTVFRVKTDGSGFALLHAFASGASDGSNPQSPLVLDGSGGLYGTTVFGGPSNSGTVFTLKTDGTGFALLHGFAGGASDGSSPYAGLVPDGSGNLYGTTSQEGGSNYGTVFTLKTAGTGFALLHGFTNGASDGGSPYGTIVRDAAGKLYGTASTGGAWNDGTLFALNTDGTGFTLLHGFSGTTLDGSAPYSELVLDGSGNIYGTTQTGGTFNLGTLFTMRSDGTGFALLHAFAGGASDGETPRCRLVLDGSGNLYGTTTSGGASNHGTVFTLKTNGTGFALLHSFADSPSDGSDPEAGLIPDGLGNLYGTTQFGGPGLNGGGTVFKMKTDGNGYVLLHSFDNAWYSPRTPTVPLVLDGSGILYGTAQSGGCFFVACSASASIFKLATDGSGYTEMPIPYSGGTLGSWGDFSGVVLDGLGGLYGAASIYSKYPIIYKINTDGSGFTTLHTFNDTQSHPLSALLLDASGTLFGTMFNGEVGKGMVFSLKSDGSAYRVLHDFAGAPSDGAFPYAGLVLDAAGNLYGTTSAGGSGDAGTEFAFLPPPPLAFYKLTPCRIVDTRSANGPLGGPALAGGSVRTFPLVGTCGLPTQAQAVAVNLTAVAPGSAGYLTVFDGVYPPPTSSISFVAGRNRANNATLALDSRGALSAYAALPSGSQTDFLIDVVGYFR